MIFKRYIFQWLELMNQKSCLGNNNEQKQNIFDIQFPLHNLNNYKIHIYIFIFLLHDFRWYIVVGVFVNKTWNELCIYFWSFVPDNVWLNFFLIHLVAWIMINIYPEILLVNHLWLFTYFPPFLCQIYQTIRFKDVQLQLQQKNMDLMMHHNLTKRVLSMVKNHLWKMMKLKLLVQGLKLIETFHQLADTYNLHKHVSNIQIEIYDMHLICF